MMKSTTRKTLAETLYNNIKVDIESGKIAPSSKLPSENELTVKYNVSRVTVRTALQQLRTEGFITTLMGDGSYVTDNRTPHMLQELSRKILPQGNMDNVMEFRRVIDEACIRATVKNATDEELEDLEALAHRYYNLLKNCDVSNESSVLQLVEADYNLHFEICKLSKNPLFVLAYLAAQTTIREYLRAILVFRNTIYTHLYNIPVDEDSHILLCSTIRQRDADEACQISSKIADYEILPPKKDGYSNGFGNFENN